MKFRIAAAKLAIGFIPAYSGDAKVPKGHQKSRRDFGNFRLAAKTLHFDYALPWRLVAATADFDNWGPLWDQVRTFFQSNALKSL